MDIELLVEKTEGRPFTIHAVCDILGIPKYRAQKAVKILMEDGEVEMTEIQTCRQCSTYLYTWAWLDEWAD